MPPSGYITEATIQLVLVIGISMELASPSTVNSSVEEKRYYLSSENLAWGVVIPTDFAWPLEYKNIKDVYTDFVSWVTTGGKENKDWYNNHNGQVFKK